MERFATIVNDEGVDYMEIFFLRLNFNSVPSWKNAILSNFMN